jgi:hypothetical protein
VSLVRKTRVIGAFSLACIFEIGATLVAGMSFEMRVVERRAVWRIRHFFDDSIGQIEQQLFH